MNNIVVNGLQNAYKTARPNEHLALQLKYEKKLLKITDIENNKVCYS